MPIYHASISIDIMHVNWTMRCFLQRRTAQIFALITSLIIRCISSFHILAAPQQVSFFCRFFAQHSFFFLWLCFVIASQFSFYQIRLVLSSRFCLMHDYLIFSQLNFSISSHLSNSDQYVAVLTIMYCTYFSQFSFEYIFCFLFHRLIFVISKQFR